MRFDVYMFHCTLSDLNFQSLKLVVLDATSINIVTLQEIWLLDYLSIFTNKLTNFILNFFNKLLSRLSK